MYIHSKLDYKKNLFIHLLCLVPLVIYGIYKNGFLLYQKNLIDIWEVFKPFYLIIIGFAIYEVEKLLIKKRFIFDNDLLSYLLVCMIVPPTINIYIFSLGFTIALLINDVLSRKFIYNKTSFSKLIIILLCILISNYGYQNVLEVNYNFSFNCFDYFLGKGVGGICATSIILMIFSYFILSSIAVYKKLIPIVCYIGYLIGCLIYFIIIDNFDINILINANVLFAFIFVAVESKSSPYVFKKCVIYGIIISILTLVFSKFINVYEGVYIAIFLSSLLFNIKKQRKKELDFFKK